MADWRQFYTAAILNADPGCIGFVLDEAAHAMDLRLNELATTCGYSEERHEIALAARGEVTCHQARGVGRVEVARGRLAYVSHRLSDRPRGAFRCGCHRGIAEEISSTRFREQVLTGQATRQMDSLI
jgi:hypothetical protein